MSTRTRSRPTATSYTARLHQRTAAPRRARTWPAWLTTRRLPALVALAAELGHLAAILTEWPASASRGVFHVLAAAALGLLATSIYFGPSRFVPVWGTGVALALPAAWLAGMVAGVSPYRNYPTAAAAALGLLEMTLAGLLAGPWRTAAAARPGRRLQPERGASRGR